MDVTTATRLPHEVEQALDEHFDALLQTSFFPADWRVRADLRQRLFELTRNRLDRYYDHQCYSDHEVEHRLDTLGAIDEPARFPVLRLRGSLGGTAGALAIPEANVLFIDPDPMQFGSRARQRTRDPDEAAGVVRHEEAHLRGHRLWSHPASDRLCAAACGWRVHRTAPGYGTPEPSEEVLFSVFDEATALAEQRKVLEGLGLRGSWETFTTLPVNLFIESARDRELRSLIDEFAAAQLNPFLTLTPSAAGCSIEMRLRRLVFSSSTNGEPFGLGYPTLVENIELLRSLSAAPLFDELLSAGQFLGQRNALLARIADTLGPTAPRFFARLQISDRDMLLFRLFVTAEALRTPRRDEVRDRLTRLVELGEEPFIARGTLNFPGRNLRRLPAGCLQEPHSGEPHYRELRRLVRRELQFLQSHGSEQEAAALERHCYGESGGV